MADEPDNLVLRSLRRMDANFESLRDDMQDVRTRLGLLEQQYAGISSRLDRVEVRLDRLEKRFDLVES